MENEEEIKDITSKEVDNLANLSQFKLSKIGFHTHNGTDSSLIILTLKQITDALSYTPEDIANKDTTTILGASDTLYPSQKAVKTYVDNNHPVITYKNGTINKNADNTTATQISHGLGRIPRFIRITAIADTGKLVSTGVYNGTTQTCIYADMQIANGGSTSSYTIFFLDNSGTNGGAVTVDIDNIDIAWTKVSTPTSIVIRVLWEAY